MSGNGPSRLANWVLLLCLVDFLLTPVIYLFIQPFFYLGGDGWLSYVQIVFLTLGLIVFVAGSGHYFDKEYRCRFAGEEYDNSDHVSEGLMYHITQLILLLLYLLFGQYWRSALCVVCYMVISYCVTVALGKASGSSSQDGNARDENSRLIENV